MTLQRNIIFDQLKGILIILVIIGHVALDDVPNNVVRTYLYFFHMPLFLAITGYFIRPSLFNLSSKNILLKYKDRLLLPYLLAFAFYTLLQLINVQHFKQVIALFLYPYYHLWYIPAVIFYIFYAKYLYIYQDKVNLYRKVALVILFLFALCTAYFEYYRQWNVEFSSVYAAKLYSIIGDKRFYFYFSYFYFGYLLGQNTDVLNKLRQKSYIIISFVLAISGILVYTYYDVPIIQGGGNL